MKFIADDGKIFDTMDECEEYEKMSSVGKEIAQLWNKYITMYDIEGTVKIPRANWTDTTEFFHEVTELIMENYNTCAFIDISSACKGWLEICNFLYDEYGLILPDDVGLWRYDIENEEWVSLKEEIKRFEENWAPFNIHC
jgi:hypothetical protein